MANEKQYLEVLNNGQDDLYIRDQEAQAELSQIPNTYATKQDTYTKAEVDEMALGTMFKLYVDPADMHLKGKNIQDGTFEVVDGHLILHQTE